MERPADHRRRRVAALAATFAVAALAVAPAAEAGGGSSPRRVLDDHTRLWANPHGPAGRQARLAAAEGRTEDAALYRRLARIPTAEWFTKGTPDEVREGVAAVTRAARRKHRVPVLVAYNVPGRDCSQYSSGGAGSEAAYRAWIDGFAAGIGRRPAVVILEPDGLALLPSEPWCGEGGGGFSGTPEDLEFQAERFREIRYGVARLSALPRTAVYIDAGHSAWQALNDYDAGYGEPRQQLGMASRLIRGGIARADGFFLNVSNYRSDAELEAYGTRLSKCVAHRQFTGDTACPDDATLDALPLEPRWQPHFVTDTSRNGQGPWDKDPADFVVPTPPLTPGQDVQDWCNPPGRGLGARPTTRTAHPLHDAKLWVKVPGESDGQCTRGFTTLDGVDPAWGMVDPPAGAWFPEQIRQLVELATPPLG